MSNTTYSLDVYRTYSNMWPKGIVTVMQFVEWFKAINNRDLGDENFRCRGVYIKGDNIDKGVKAETFTIEITSYNKDRIPTQEEIEEAFGWIIYFLKLEEVAPAIPKPQE